MRVLTTSPLAVFLIAAMGVVCAGDEASPWERPGTTAGEEIIGPDGGKMVWVPLGQFNMGSEDDDANVDEKPVHLVKISKGFWLGKCEVTNAQYRRFCEATGREFPFRSNQGDDHPVVWVDWHDAVAYCEHYGLRLPTEAEWEYAAAGPEGRKYPWGNNWDEKKCCSWHNTGPGGRTFPVGSFPEAANWCGAFDMAGNVFEWCSDWYAHDYYARSSKPDPQGPCEADAENVPRYGKSRVGRGGSWSLTPIGFFRCAARFFNFPTGRDVLGGFRCAGAP